jgi:hypothetical protein
LELSLGAIDVDICVCFLNGKSVRVGLWARTHGNFISVQDMIMHWPPLCVSVCKTSVSVLCVSHGSFAPFPLSPFCMLVIR